MTAKFGSRLLASGVVKASVVTFAGAPGMVAIEAEGAIDELNLLTATTQADSYTLALTDAGHVVEATKATAMTITVPPNSTVAFPVGAVIEILQYGAGQVTIAPGAGVTLRAPGARLKTAQTYSGASIRQRATDEWVVVGDLVA